MNVWWYWIYENKDVLQTLASCGVVIFAIIGTFVSVFAWKAAAASAEAARISAETAGVGERAYENMSQVSPGVRVNAVEEGKSVEVRVSVKVKNNGRTPAAIKESVLVLSIMEGLPEEPPYPSGEGMESY